MKTDIENIGKKESTGKRDLELDQTIDQKKDKMLRTSNREQISIIKNFIGKDVIITLRNGDNLKGKLETVSQYELLITVAYIPMLVMKHAVDYITLTGEK